MNNNKSSRSLAETYYAMQNPASTKVQRPNWVPASVAEDAIPAFTKAIHEAHANGQKIVEFAGKKYSIKDNAMKEEDPAKQGADLDKETGHNIPDDAMGKDIQSMDRGNAPTQPMGQLPKEVTKEDSAATQRANATDKATQDDPQHTLPMMAEKEDEDEKGHTEPDADNMGGKSDHDADNADDEKKSKDMDEKLVGGQKKLDVNHNGKIDSDDLQKLRAMKDEGYEESMHMDEKLTASDPADKWIHDFVHSKNPKFAGKSTEMRKKMALGAYYGAKNEAREYEYQPGMKSMLSVADAYSQMLAGPITEGTPDKSKAGPEIMDPKTRQMAGDLNRSVKVEDRWNVGAAQDGSEKVMPADHNKPEGSTTAVEPEPSLESPKDAQTGADKVAKLPLNSPEGSTTAVEPAPSLESPKDAQTGADKVGKLPLNSPEGSTTAVEPEPSLESPKDAQTGSEKIKQAAYNKAGAGNAPMIKVKEDMDYADDSNEEVKMACRQLRKISSMADEIEDLLYQGDNLRAWISAKITQAADRLDDVHGNLAFKKSSEVDESVKEVDDSALLESMDQLDEATGLPVKPKNPHGTFSAKRPSFDAHHASKLATHYSNVANKSKNKGDHMKAMRAHQKAQAAHDLASSAHNDNYGEMKHTSSRSADSHDNKAAHHENQAYHHEDQAAAAK